MDINRMMLLIKSLDPGASLDFSQYTNKWFVSASIEIGDGAILSGITEHATNPELAVEKYWDRLTRMPVDKFLVTRYRGHRREWRWNGAAFAECTRQMPI